MSRPATWWSSSGVMRQHDVIAAVALAEAVGREGETEDQGATRIFVDDM